MSRAELWIKFIISWFIPTSQKFYFRQPHPILFKIARGALKGHRTLSDRFYQNTRSVVLMLNPFYGHQGENLEKNFYYQTWVQRMNRRLPTYCMERSPFPGGWILDPTGFHAESTLYDPRHWEKPLSTAELELVNRLSAWVKISPESWETQPPLLGNLPELARMKARFQQLNLVILQVRKDTVVLRYPGFCGSQEGMLSTLVKMALELPEQLFLLKPHPLDPDWIEARDLPENMRLVKDAHYKDLLSLADRVITMNSGLGVQALVWGKPVIHLGKSYYEWGDLVNQPQHETGLKQALLSCKEPDMDAVQRYLLHLLRVISWEPFDKNPIVWNHPQKSAEQIPYFPYA